MHAVERRGVKLSCVQWSWAARVELRGVEYSNSGACACSGAARAVVLTVALLGWKDQIPYLFLYYYTLLGTSENPVTAGQYKRCVIKHQYYMWCTNVSRKMGMTGYGFLVFGVWLFGKKA